MIYTDIRELKKLFDIHQNDLSEDWKLLLYAEWATGLINTFIGREVDYKSRTQYYNGTGTQKLLLRNRPVYRSPGGGFSTLAVNIDSGGYYGTATDAFTGDDLVYGTDYTLQIDQDDGGSRSGILIRINDYWPRPQNRQWGYLSPFVGPDTGSIKVVYTAGWTTDTLPANFRMAADLLVARLRYLYPLGMETTSESYEERSISMGTDRKDYLLSLIKPLLTPYRNWKF